jgi:hypothetical protein
MDKDLQYSTKLLMVTAVIKVLEGLGRQPFSLIEQYLKNFYGLSLTAVDGKGSYSLEQLREGLQNLLGDHAATRILEDILIELDKLTESSDLRLRKRKRK